MRYNSFIFDFDGVIADTESVWFECLLAFVQRHRLAIPQSVMEDYIGDGDTKMMGLLADALGSREELDRLYFELRDDFRERTKDLPTRAGLLDYFDFADRNQIKIVCASNSDRKYIDFWLTKLGIINRFYAVITREYVGKDRIKPCPDLYLHALTVLDVQATDCIAFEDTPIGLQAAEAADILAIAVPNRATQAKTNRLPNYQLHMDEKTPEEFNKEISLLKSR